MANDQIDWKPLVEGASRAPSGDNTQPWEVSVAGNALELYYAPTKAPGFYDVDNVSRYLALGAWLHNFKVLSSHAGYRATVTLIPSGTVVARITLEKGEEKIGDASAVLSRRTNRFPYQQKPLAPEQKEKLEKVLLPYGVTIAWLLGKDKEEFQCVAPELENIFWKFPEHRTSLLSILKLGSAKSAETGIHRTHFGVAFGGVSAVLGLFLSRHVSLIWKMGCLAVASVDRRNLKHSSAVLLLYANAPDGLVQNTRREFWLTTGMALEEFWLATTKEHLAVQPFYSIIVFGLRKFFGLPVLTKKYAALEEHANNILEKHRPNKNAVAFMCMRIGTPIKTPSTLSLRKPFAKILRASS
ncbi:MAG: hypothetical protein Q7S52_00570 [bacterium]|nr:hypothetical protein [bacterium]